jgi:hypothetical protein
MIYKGKCNICGQQIRINGQNAYEDAIRGHYIQKHSKEYRTLVEQKKQADNELSKLKKKYPGFYISFANFCLDTTKLFNQEVE